MKSKQVFATLFFLFLVSSVIGQQKKFSLGISGGPSLSDFRGSAFEDISDEPALNYSIGVNFRYFITPNVSIRTGAFFERKGETGLIAGIREITPTIQDTNYAEIRSILEYFTFPLIISIYPGKQNRLYLNIGSYFSTRINEIAYGIYENAVYSGNSIGLFDDNYANYDFGIIGGLGIQFPLSNQFSLSTELQYNHGLLNVAEQVYRGGELMNSSLNLLLAISKSF